MAYTITKEKEIIFSGFENGIGASPHDGFGNMQNANIATEKGEVMCSFGRVLESQEAISGTGDVTYLDASHLTLSDPTIKAGLWITVASSTHTGELPNGNYYILSNTGTSAQLATTYNGSAISGFTSGLTAIFNPIREIGNPIAKATETYNDGSDTQHRYYILDENGLLWTKDSAITTDGVDWFLADISLLADATGMTVLNGWIMVFTATDIWCKSTVLLGASPGWVNFVNVRPLSVSSSSAPHFAFVGHQGKCYYTDGNFIGSIFPNTTLVTGGTTPNIQSYASYTASTTTGTISALIGGSVPSALGLSTGLPRVPVVFFTDDTEPTAITVGTIYYIEYKTLLGTFEVFTASTGGSAIDIETGASGTQYFNTFYPTSVGGEATILWTPQRLVLPFAETSQYMAELGNNVIVGCRSNILYPWNQIDVLPGDLIPLPEEDVDRMITVNNMVYVFAGRKGNIYVTNGSTASAAISVPDYTAGVPGTPSSYVEPYFIWGDAMYLRGRVYFSIQDQTSIKAGNCGGIWSFVPSQNLFSEQDVGLSLRLENISSYNTYDGVCGVLIESKDQEAKSPQYWSGWKDDITSPEYGIDFTATTPIRQTIIETDAVPTGTSLDKKTFSQIEYKLSAPRIASESILIYYRQNLTDSWTICEIPIVESVFSLSGYCPVNFQKGQWLQLRIVMTPGAVSTGSFVRLKQIIVR